MFKYKIFIPDGLMHEGEVTMIVVPSAEGELGILEEHLSLFSLLQPGLVRLYNDNIITAQYFIEGGVVKVKEDVFIFTEEVINIANLNRSEIEVRINSAKQELLKDPLNTKKIKEYDISQMLLNISNVKV